MSTGRNMEHGNDQIYYLLTQTHLTVTMTINRGWDHVIVGFTNYQWGGIIFFVCDLEKAFDCVSHDILLSKLKFYGFSDKDFQLYQSYLGNRYCKTAIYNDSENSNKV